MIDKRNTIRYSNKKDDTPSQLRSSEVFNSKPELKFHNEVIERSNKADEPRRQERWGTAKGSAGEPIWNNPAQ